MLDSLIGDVASRLGLGEQARPGRVDVLEGDDGRLRVVDGSPRCAPTLARRGDDDRAGGAGHRSRSGLRESWR